MIQMIDHDTVEVARIMIDDKNEDKSLVEYLISSCLSPLGFYDGVFIQEMNFELVHRYNYFVSIETYVNRLAEVIQQQTEGTKLIYQVDGNELYLSLTCTQQQYHDSVYSDPDFMINVKKRKKMIIDVKTKEIPKNDYYWFRTY